MRLTRKSPFVRAVLPTGLVLLWLMASSGGSHLTTRTIPLWWDIVLELKATGEYRLDGRELPLQGRFRFTLRWTGCMESDDHDYLLYRLGCDLSSWEAQETSSSPRGGIVLTTADFPDKPSLDMKYILRQGSRLIVCFSVSGFDFPQGEADETFELVFPASAEVNYRDSWGVYNEFVVRGSNHIWVEEAEIYAHPVARTFDWEWRRQRWVLRQQQTVFTSQSHRVEVSLAVIPHASFTSTR